VDSNFNKAYGQSVQPYLNRYLRQESPAGAPEAVSAELAPPEVKTYEDGLDADYDESDFDYSDAYLEGDTAAETVPLGRSEAEGRIEALWQWLRSGGLTGAARSDWAGQIRELATLVQKSPNGGLNSDAQALLQKLEAQAFGTSASGEAPVDADPFGVEGFLESSESEIATDGAGLSQELNDLKQQINKNENLTDSDREGFLEKVDRYLSNLELGASEESIDEIRSELETLKGDLAEVSNHAPAVSRLAKITGTDPATIEALMEKHGIDPKNLPSRPDSKVAALLSDGELSEKISTQLDLHQKMMTNFQQEIDSHIAEANNINSANEGSDTSKVDTQSFTAHRWLYNAHFHRDERSQEIIGAREAIATDTANLLGALYGEEVQVLSGPEAAGMIQMGSTKLNVVPEAGAGALAFTTKAPEWLPVELVTAFVDDEGDGKTKVVSWMQEAHYPYHIYDTGGACYSPSGNWSWDQNTVDIGKAV